MKQMIITTNDALVAAHIRTITIRTGSALTGTGESPESWGCCYYHDAIKGGARSFRWENLIAVLS